MVDRVANRLEVQSGVQPFVDFIVLHDKKLAEAEKNRSGLEIIEHIRNEIQLSFQQAREKGFSSNQIEVSVNGSLPKGRYWFFPETAQEKVSFQQINTACRELQDSTKMGYNHQIYQLRVIFAAQELAQFSFERLRFMLKAQGLNLSLDTIRKFKEIILKPEQVDENLSGLFGRKITASAEPREGLAPPANYFAIREDLRVRPEAPNNEYLAKWTTALSETLNTEDGSEKVQKIKSLIEQARGSLKAKESEVGEIETLVANFIQDKVYDKNYIWFSLEKLGVPMEGKGGLLDILGVVRKRIIHK